ncbi:Heat shock protein hsp98 [Ascosphaera atra]|nr:Heat shock protein hsp98 [Ascosphaera atra]
MTSNIGAEYFNRPGASEGKTDPQTRELVMSAIRENLLPEFINRINCIVIYNRLTREGVRQIVDIRIAEIEKRLAANGKKIKVQCSEEVKDYLGEAGYSPQYGARPLARIIDKEMLDRMAVLILRESIKDGETARVIMQNGKPYVIPNHVTSVVDGMSDDEMDVDGDVDDSEDEIGGSALPTKRGSTRGMSNGMDSHHGRGRNTRKTNGFDDDEDMSEDDDFYN